MTTTPATAPEGAKLTTFTLDEPAVWLDVPLGNPAIPEAFRGLSYRQIASCPEGRSYLEGRGAEDAYAAKTLEVVANVEAQDAAEAAAAALNGDAHVEPKPLPFDTSREITARIAEDVKKALPEAMKAVLSVAATELPARMKSTPLTQPEIAAVQRAVLEGQSVPGLGTCSVCGKEKEVVQGNAICPLHPDAAPSPDVVKLKKQTKAQEKKQDAKVDADVLAAERAEVERRIFAALEQPEAAEDRAFLADVQGGFNPTIAQNRGRLAFEEALKTFGSTVEITNAIEAAVVVRATLEARDELERFNYEIAALQYRYERRVKVCEALLPKLEVWAKEARAKKLAAGDTTAPKTVKLPLTTQRITFKDTPAGFEILDEKEAKLAAEKQLGLDGAIASGIVRVEERLSRSGLVEWLESSKTTKFPGVKPILKGEQMILYRK